MSEAIGWPHGLMCGECDRVILQPGEMPDASNVDKQPWAQVWARDDTGEVQASIVVCVDCWLRTPEVPPDVTGGVDGVA